MTRRPPDGFVDDGEFPSSRSTPTLSTCTAWGWIRSLGRLMQSGQEDSKASHHVVVARLAFLPGVRNRVTSSTATTCTRARLGTYAFCSRMGLGSMGIPHQSSRDGRPMFLRHLRSSPSLRSAGFRIRILCSARHQCARRRRPPQSTLVRGSSVSVARSTHLHSYLSPFLDRHHPTGVRLWPPSDPHPLDANFVISPDSFLPRGLTPEINDTVRDHPHLVWTSTRVEAHTAM